MGCGGSKEDVATANTTANGNRLFRRKSTVAVKDVVKETAAGEAKAEVEVTSAEKPVAVVVEEKEEVVVVKKDVTEDAAATAAATLEAKVDDAKEKQPKKEEEVVLPKSTMADEAVVEEEAKVDEAMEVVLKEEEKVEETNAEEEKETSPAPTNEDGESVGRSTTEPVEAKLVDEHKVEEAAAVLEPLGKKNADEPNAAAAAAPSESPAN